MLIEITKKSLILHLVVLVVILFLCLSVNSVAAKYTIIFNGPQNAEHNLTKGAELFAKLVEERTDGDVKVNLYINGVLGGGREALEAVKVGTQTMVDATIDPIVSYEPAFGILSLPFLFSCREQAYDILDGPLGTELLGLLENHGFVGLGYAEEGTYHLTNNVRPIYKPEDLKGIKMRVMQSPIIISTYKALGALPAPIPWVELYSALQQGVVDAQENPIVNIYGAKFYEVQKYLSLTKHKILFDIYFMNKDFFYGLPEEYQKIVKEAAKEAINFQRKQAQIDEKAQLEELEKYMEVNELSPEEHLRFREACKVVYEEQEEFIGKELIDKWKKAIENWGEND